jgi:hypothetical protein
MNDEEYEIAKECKKCRLYMVSENGCYGTKVRPVYNKIHSINCDFFEMDETPVPATCGSCLYYKNGCAFSESDLPEEKIKNFLCCENYINVYNNLIEKY